MGNSLVVNKGSRLANSVLANGLKYSRKLANSVLASGAVSFLISLF